MGWFSIDQEFNGAVWFPDDEGVKKWNLTIFSLLVGEFDITYLLSHVYDPLIKKSRTVKETVSRRLLITCQSGSDGHSDEVSWRSETKY